MTSWVIGCCPTTEPRWLGRLGPFIPITVPTGTLRHGGRERPPWRTQSQGRAGRGVRSGLTPSTPRSKCWRQSPGAWPSSLRLTTFNRLFDHSDLGLSPTATKAGHPETIADRRPEVRHHAWPGQGRPPQCSTGGPRASLQGPPRRSLEFRLSEPHIVSKLPLSPSVTSPNGHSCWSSPAARDETLVHVWSWWELRKRPKEPWKDF